MKGVHQGYLINAAQKKKCSKVLHMVTRKNLHIYLNIVFSSSTFTKKRGLFLRRVTRVRHLPVLMHPNARKLFCGDYIPFSEPRCCVSRHKQWSVPAVTWGRHRPTCVASSNVFLPPKDQTPLPPGLTQRLRLTSEEFIAPGLGALLKDTCHNMLMF